MEADFIDIGESPQQNCQNAQNNDDNESVKEILFGTEGIADQTKQKSPKNKSNMLDSYMQMNIRQLLAFDKLSLIQLIQNQEAIDSAKSYKII